MSQKATRKNRKTQEEILAKRIQRIDDLREQSGVNMYDKIFIVTWPFQLTSSLVQSTDFKSKYLTLAQYYRDLGGKETLKLLNSYGICNSIIASYIDRMIEEASKVKKDSEYLIVQDELGNIVPACKLKEGLPLLQALADLFKEYANNR